MQGKGNSFISQLWSGPRIEPTTIRQAVTRFTDWTYPASVKRWRKNVKTLNRKTSDYELSKNNRRLVFFFLRNAGMTVNPQIGLLEHI